MKLLFLVLTLCGTNLSIAKSIGHEIARDTDDPSTPTQENGTKFKAEGYFDVPQVNAYAETNISHDAKVIYTQPTAKLGDESDNSHANFPASAEKNRIIVYDLGSVRKLSEFGSVHSPRPVRFKVYVFDQLPERTDWSGRRTFDPKAIESSTPVLSLTEPKGVGYIKGKTPKPVSGRYVAIVWELDYLDAN